MELANFFGLFAGLILAFYAFMISARSTKDSYDKAPFRCLSPLGYMKGRVPNPDPLNCSMYYTCVDSKPGSVDLTYPVPNICPPGRDGLIFYDFLSCDCKVDPDVCFDRVDDEDLFWNCAEVYIPGDNSSQTTDLPNEPSDSTLNEY